jgi:hypothetical protein
MLKGLRKRETYDELINELGEDPIKKYPDRRASQIENSNFMSQLALGFQEVIEQNNRAMKEKTKSLLLEEFAESSSSRSHHEFRSLSSLGMTGLFASAERPSFIPTERPTAPGNMLFDVASYEEDNRKMREILKWTTPIADQSREMERPSAPGNMLFDVASYEEDNRKMREILKWTTPIADQSREMERQYQEQLAIVQHEAEHERRQHQETLLQVMDQTRSLLNRANSTNIDSMIRPYEQPSSSSSAPNRLPIQDVEQARLAIQDSAAAAATSAESSSDPEGPAIRPGMLLPRSEDVRHLYKPKHERTKKRTTMEKEYFDTFEEWNREGIKFLKDQITYRPEIKLSRTEIHNLTKPRAIYLIREYDKNNPKKY